MQTSPDARADVAIVGEINPDLILSGVPRELPPDREMLADGCTLTLGSSSAILAHNLALLGARVSFSSRVGQDFFGEFCCRRLEEAGVDLRGVVRAPSGAGTGLTVILPLDGLHGPRRIVTYPGAMFEMSLGDLDLDLIASARHFHLSSIFLHRGLTAEIPALFRLMKGRGLTTSMDTNDDPDGRWAGALWESLPFTDILFCNERELLAMSGEPVYERAVLRLRKQTRLLIVKRGRQGAAAYAEGLTREAPGLRVPVTDTVGAGDSFDAGFLYRWVRGAPLEACMAYGNLAAAYSVTRAGGTEAFRDGVARERFLERGGPEE